MLQNSEKVWLNNFFISVLHKLTYKCEKIMCIWLLLCPVSLFRLTGQMSDTDVLKSWYMVGAGQDYNALIIKFFICRPDEKFQVQYVFPGANNIHLKPVFLNIWLSWLRNTILLVVAQLQWKMWRKWTAINNSLGKITNHNLPK